MRDAPELHGRGGHCRKVPLLLAESGRGRSQRAAGCFLGKVVDRNLLKKECHKTACYLLEHYRHLMQKGRRMWI